jgi:hypothetical protein
MARGNIGGRCRLTPDDGIAFLRGSDSWRIPAGSGPARALDQSTIDKEIHPDMNRLLGRFAILVALASGGALAGATPAAAAPIPVVENRCGFAFVTVHNPMLGEQVQVTRDGDPVTSFEIVGDAVAFGVGASDGATIVVTVGATSLEHVYQAPDGCPSTPLRLRPEAACSGVLLLHTENAGTEVLLDFVLRRVSTQDQRQVPFQPGVATSFLSVAEASYQVLERLGDTMVLWAKIDYRAPDACGPDPIGAVEVVFSDGCDLAAIDVTSAVDPPQFYFAIRNVGSEDEEHGEITETGVVSSKAPGRHEIPALPGDVLTVLVSTGGDDSVATEVVVAEHAYTEPADCDDTGGASGGLPDTGFRIALPVAGGLILLAGGALLIVADRRRRTRLSADS